MSRTWNEVRPPFFIALLLGLLMPGLAMAQTPQISFCDQQLPADAEEIRCEDAILPDLSALAGFTALKRLFLEAEVESPDFSFLAALQNLEELTLSRVGIQDLSPLSSLRSLRRLMIVQNTPFLDLSPIGSLTTLDTLILTSNEVVAPSLNLMALRTLTALRSLSINVTTKEPIDITVVASLKKLTHLSLTGAFASVAPTTKLAKLVALSLSTDQLVDLEVYASLTALKDITVRSSKITTKELKAFQILRPKVNIQGCKMILDPPCAVPKATGDGGVLEP